MRHESNAVEEVASCAARALGLPGLEACHRLDKWTTGLLVCSNDREAIRGFKALLEMKGSEAEAEVAAPGEAIEGDWAAGSSGRYAAPLRTERGSDSGDSPSRLSKIYLALTDRSVPLGRLTGFMYDGPFRPNGNSSAGSVPPDPLADAARGLRLPARGPRLLSRYRLPGWKHVVSDVLECRRVPAEPIDKWMQRGRRDPAACDVGGMALEGGGRARSNPPPQQFYWCSRVRLVTGRTHQIRAQFAAEGCPLLGDAMYQGMQGRLVPQSGRIQDPDLAAQIVNLPQVDGPIGLHAAEILWDERVIRVGAPWEEV